MEAGNAPEWCLLGIALENWRNIATVILAVVAVFSLVLTWRNVRGARLQGRATLLLRLEEDWRKHRETREKIHSIRGELLAKVNEDFAGLKDAHRLEEFRKDCHERINQMRTQQVPLYNDFVEYVGFFETVGLMVRNKYLPLEDVVKLYKGPILATDDMARLHIETWQRLAHMPPGLLENFLFLADETRRLDFHR